MRAEGVRVPLVDLGPQHEPIVADLEAAWRTVLASGRFIGGPEVERFEEQWASYCGVKHAAGVANGTDALLLTIRALGIGAGDEVIVPANTFVATAEAVVLAGATPRFVDVDPKSLVVTSATIEPALGPRTAAVIVVHLYGHTPDMDDVLQLTTRANVALIEDAAQAHGATWNGKPAGSFGVAGCFSFYPAKNLGAIGDGGAVVSNDASLIEKIRIFGDHGRSIEDRGTHREVGTNSRLDALQAALLTVKLGHLDEWTASRRTIAATYRSRLAEIDVAMVEGDSASESAYHLLVVRLDRRDDVRLRLAQRGIETGIHYPVPCHKQVPYKGYGEGTLPVAEHAAGEILSLPFFPHMTDDAVDEVIVALEHETAKTT